jgi:hypothetical protein
MNRADKSTQALLQPVTQQLLAAFGNCLPDEFRLGFPGHARRSLEHALQHGVESNTFHDAIVSQLTALCNTG